MCGKPVFSRRVSRFLVGLLCLIFGPALFAKGSAWYFISDPSHGVSLSIPKDAVVSTGQPVNADGAQIHTSVMTVALNPSSYKGTNLHAASVSVSSSKDPDTTAICGTGKAQEGETSAGTIKLDGVSFARFTASDAGAGSRRSWTMYRAVHHGRCYEIVEQLSWAVLENYPVRKVKAFDRAQIEGQLHAITQHLKFNQPVGVPPSR